MPNKTQTISLKRNLLDKRTRVFLFLHAWSLLLIPLLGTIVAIMIGIWFRIGFLEFGLLFFMYFLSVIGITVGFHRHFSHTSFQTCTFVRLILGVLGSMSCQGPLIYWVSNHRRHHQYSDCSYDPHSPYLKGEKPLSNLRGLWHAHIGWIFCHELTNPMLYCKDLLKDKLVMKINQLYLLWVFLGLAFPSLLGGIITGTWMGVLTGFLWGGLVRIFFVSHMSFCINSVCHFYGKTPFYTMEKSKNNMWLAIPTFGEAWHNNHHAFPWSAKFGLNKTQIDLGYYFISFLKTIKLVWKVKIPNTEQIADKEKSS